MAASACLEIWLWKCGRIPNLSGWERSLAAVLLFVLDALLQKKDLIKGNGVSCHSNRDIFSFRHTASPLAFGGICNSVRNCSLYDHIHDA